MTAGRLLLVRHGRTAYNSQARLQGQVDIPLDDVGRWQARTAAALLLARHEPTVDRHLRPVARPRDGDASSPAPPAWTSSSTRACGSAAFGVWEGLTGDDLRRDWADEFAVWRAGGQPEGVGAETRAEVAARDERGHRRARRRPRSRRHARRRLARLRHQLRRRRTARHAGGLARLHRHAQRPLDRAGRHPRRLRARLADGRLQPRARPTRRPTGTPDRTPRHDADSETRDPD